MNNYQNLFKQFAPGLFSDNVMDADAAAKVYELSKLTNEELTADKVKAILDDIVFGSLASDFVVGVLDVIWQQLLEKEKKNF